MTIAEQEVERKLQWDDLIREAEQRIKSLKSSLSYFKQMKKAGLPVPIDFPAPTPDQQYRYIEI